MTCSSPSHRTLGLRALLYCVFDKEEGPTVCCSDPPHAVGKQFKPLGRYLLPETFVRGRVVSVVLDDNVILGAPVYIEDTLYDRNCFQFNICAVIGSRLDAEPYREMAQHLASAFHALEVEIKLLSRQQAASRVQCILAALRRQLAASGECFVRVDGSHCISFLVRLSSPVLVAEPGLSEVPVPLVDLEAMLRGSAEHSAAAGAGGQPLAPFEPDLTLVHVAQFVDGASTVREVVQASGLDRDSVLLCLRHLIHFGLVALIQEITLECRYWLTPEFHCAFDRPDTVGEAVRYVTAGEREGDQATVQAVQALYARIDGWNETLGEFRQANAEELQRLGVSLRHFVTFGLLRGFLERVDSSGLALSQEEASELENLRCETIPQRKQALKASGMTSADVNRDEEVKRMVVRMNELKAKERGRPMYSLSGWEDAGEGFRRQTTPKSPREA